MNVAEEGIECCNVAKHRTLVRPKPLLPCPCGRHAEAFVHRKCKLAKCIPKSVGHLLNGPVCFLSGVEAKLAHDLWLVWNAAWQSVPVDRVGTLERVLHMALKLWRLDWSPYHAPRRGLDAVKAEAGRGTKAQRGSGTRPARRIPNAQARPMINDIATFDFLLRAFGKVRECQLSTSGIRPAPTPQQQSLRLRSVVRHEAGAKVFAKRLRVLAHGLAPSREDEILTADDRAG